MADQDERIRALLGLSGASSSPLASAYNPYSYSSPDLDFGAVGTNARGFRQEDRNLWDRIFAPIEAPQQVLYGLSTGMGVWESLSHGARYFNPWSNEGRISEDEVRETFFGSKADGWVRGAQNMAIAMLFDPLMLAPITRLARAPEAVSKTVSLATNPIELMVDATRVAAKAGAPIARSAFTRVLGEEAVRNVDRLATSFIGRTLQRGYGAPEGLMDELLRAEGRVAHWYGEGTQVVKSADRLGPNAQNLLTEAMQTEDIWLRQSGAQLTPQQIRSANNFDDKLLDSGILPDAFWAVYQRGRKLDDEMGQHLLDIGAISQRQFEELRGTHLRRIYAAHENPIAYAEKIEATLGTPLEHPDRVYTSANSLLRSMREFTRDISPVVGPIHPQPTMFGNTVEGIVDSSRYFDNSGKFHAKNFTTDLVDYLNRESVSSVDEVLKHVRDNMLAGANAPAKFYAEIGNYMSGALQVWGSESLAKGLRERGMRAVMGQNAPQMVFKPFKENLDAVLNRQDLPQWVRDALGEITEFSPRMASQVKEVGGLIAARELFQNLSGTKRVSAEAFELMQEANRLGLDTDQARKLMEQAASSSGVTVDELAEAFTRVMAEGPGTEVGTKGSRWASLERNDELGHSFQMPNDPSFGDMAGMWVDAGTVTLLHGTDARASLASAASRASGGTSGETAKLLATLGDLYRDGVGAFKYMKAVFDPTGQFRNFAGAAILANMAGFGFDAIKYIPKMFRETTQWIQKGELGEYLKIADDAGVNIFKTDMFSTEMSNIARRPLEAAMMGADKPGFDWSAPFSSIIESLNTLSTRIPGVQRMANQFTGHTGSGLMDMASSTFQVGDQFWKMGVFMQNYDKLRLAHVRKGKPITDEVLQGFARQAAAIAQQSIFNYNDVPHLIKFTREWGLIPFITFPFKAIPQVARTLYSAPWRVLRYERLADGINNMQVSSPYEIADEIDRLPQHMRDSMVIRLPWEDGQGRPQYIDMSYFMPWSTIQDFLEIGERDAGGFRSPLMRPPAMAFYDGLVNNRDSLGRLVVDPNIHKTQAQKFEAMATYILTYMAPSWFPGQSRAQSWGRAMQAAAKNDPSPINWKDMLGTAARDPLGAIREAVGLGESATREANRRMVSAPAPHAQTTRPGVTGALSNFLVTQLGGATAANPRPPRMSTSEMARKIANIRSRRDLTVAEKNKLIRELREQ